MADPYVSEVKYLGGASLDFIEIAVDAGADVSGIVVTVYNANGSVRTTNTLEYLASTEFGKDIYVINTVESSTFNGLNKRGAVSLSEGTDVFQFISFDDGPPVTANSGPADTLTSDQIGQAGAGASLLSTDDGASYSVQIPPTPGTIPCFVTGTQIATPDGPVSVELLKPGEFVCDAQGGVLRVLQVILRRVSGADVISHPTMRPVRISAGALGEGVPERDLWLSRQHRLAVRSPVVERMFGCSESLVAAARLLELDGVDLIRRPGPLTYCHLLLERHGLVLAEGAPCESFLIAPVSIDAVSDQARDRIVSFFPQAMVPGYKAQTCAYIPANRQQKRLIWRHMKNDKPLISNPSAKVTA